MCQTFADLNCLWCVSTTTSLLFRKYPCVSSGTCFSWSLCLCVKSPLAPIPKGLSLSVARARTDRLSWNWCIRRMAGRGLICIGEKVNKSWRFHSRWTRTMSPSCQVLVLTLLFSSMSQHRTGSAEFRMSAIIPKRCSAKDRSPMFKWGRDAADRDNSSPSSSPKWSSGTPDQWL